MPPVTAMDWPDAGPMPGVESSSAAEQSTETTNKTPTPNKKTPYDPKDGGIHPEAIELILFYQAKVKTFESLAPLRLVSKHFNEGVSAALIRGWYCDVLTKFARAEASWTPVIRDLENCEPISELLMRRPVFGLQMRVLSDALIELERRGSLWTSRLPLGRFLDVAHLVIRLLNVKIPEEKPKQTATPEPEAMEGGDDWNETPASTPVVVTSGDWDQPVAVESSSGGWDSQPATDSGFSSSGSEELDKAWEEWNKLRRLIMDKYFMEVYQEKL